MMEDEFINVQEARLILQRYRLGESTPAENQLVEAWYRRLLDTGDWQWGEGEKEALEATIKAQLLQQIKPQPVVAHRVHFLKTSWFRYAAAVVLVAGGAATWWEISRSTQKDGAIVTTVPKSDDIQPGTNRAVLTIGNNKTINLSSNKTGIAVNNSITYTDGEKIADGGALLQLITPRGGQYQAVLPDGSKVWLNAASSIRFPSKFSSDKREVEIAGEAYLEIAKNSKQPFFIHTNKTTVQVLGTSFNVNAYPDEESEKTTLIEGSVRVIVNSALNTKNSILLAPGQEAVNQNSQLTIHNADTEAVLAWKNGSFYFNRTDIQAVMRQLARWYDVEVVYQGGIIPDVKFGGEMQRDLSLSQVLKILEKIGVRFSLEGKKIIVKP